MSTSRASKRSKTSEFSDAHFTVDDDEDDEQEIQEPRRPIGRNKARNASTSNTTGSNLDDKFNCLLSEIKGFKDQYHVVDGYRMKKLENDIQKEERKDFEFFISSHDHLIGDALEATKKRKEKIKKYDW